MYNPFHEYDRDVVEFFNTITYLGGRRTACFIRGPMNIGDGKGAHQSTDKRMNLGGPSQSVRRKYQAGYTLESGIIKSLSTAFLEHLQVAKAAPIFMSDRLEVTPCPVQVMVLP